MADPASRKLALLIDADNVPPKFIAPLMEWHGSIGWFVVRRLYGNLTTLSKVTWRNHIHQYALSPMLAIPATGTKDAADMKLAIDAMDLVHARELDGICIASSDSDFTLLAIRIRESGFAIYGFGEEKTPAPYRSACDAFYRLGEAPAAAGGKSAPEGTGRWSRRGNPRRAPVSRTVATATRAGSSPGGAGSEHRGPRRRNAIAASRRDDGSRRIKTRQGAGPGGGDFWLQSRKRRSRRGRLGGAEHSPPEARQAPSELQYSNLRLQQIQRPGHRYRRSREAPGEIVGRRHLAQCPAAEHSAARMRQGTHHAKVWLPVWVCCPPGSEIPESA